MSSSLIQELYLSAEQPALMLIWLCTLGPYPMKNDRKNNLVIRSLRELEWILCAYKFLCWSLVLVHWHGVSELMMYGLVLEN